MDPPAAINAAVSKTLKLILDCKRGWNRQPGVLERKGQTAADAALTLGKNQHRTVA